MTYLPSAGGCQSVYQVGRLADVLFPSSAIRYHQCHGAFSEENEHCTRRSTERTVHDG